MRPPQPTGGAGREPAPPDFVGVGVQKAGTSWWHTLVAAHPRVEATTSVKEAHFFAPFWQRPFTTSDVAAYHRLFARTPGSMAGEWTPRYMYDFWVPPLLREAAPDARLLVLLRDPVERYRSGLAHELQRGAPAHPVVASDAFARGLYWQQLERLMAWFPRSQILVQQLEVCRDQPRRELARTYAFLGLEPFEPDDVIDRVVNRTRDAKPDLPDGARRLLGRAYAADTTALAAAFPSLDLERWPGVAGALSG